MLNSNLLGDHATQRKSNDVEAVQLERAAESHGVLRHLCDGGGIRSSRTADAGIVQDDQVARSCEAVRNLGVPVVYVCCEIIKQQKGRYPALSKAPVRDLNLSYTNSVEAVSCVRPDIG